MNTEPHVIVDTAGRVEEIPADEPAPAEYATVDDLINAAAAVANVEEDFPLPSGLIVKIRPLKRIEVMMIGKGNAPTDVREAKYVAAALVLPRMSEKDVQRWQRASTAGDMQELVERIQFISGMSKAGEKATAAEFPE